MAKELCISKAKLYRLEKGDVMANGYVLKNLSAVFDVSIDWFLNGEGRMFRKRSKLSEPESPFGVDKVAVQHLIDTMARVPNVRYEMLIQFTDYVAAHKESIEETLAGYDRYQKKLQEEPSADLEVEAVPSPRRAQSE